MSSGIEASARSEARLVRKAGSRSGLGFGVRSSGMDDDRLSLTVCRRLPQSSGEPVRALSGGADVEPEA